jgi:hypothetical protein
MAVVVGQLGLSKCLQRLLCYFFWAEYSSSWSYLRASCFIVGVGSFSHVGLDPSLLHCFNSSLSFNNLFENEMMSIVIPWFTRPAA